MSKQSTKPLDPQQALQRAAALCASQEQCRSHIREKLRAWGLQEKKAEEVLDRLEKENYLNEERYASFYVKDKFRFNGWGKIKISHMLKAKQIGEEARRKALDEINPEAYREKCLELLREKNRSVRAKSVFERRGKLLRFASGRGFEPELIYSLLDHLEMGED